MASIPLYSAAHPESCACQACLEKLLSEPPRTKRAPTSSRQCHRPYRCVVDEMTSIGHISNRAYRNTWVALLALLCILITMAFHGD